MSHLTAQHKPDCIQAFSTVFPIFPYSKKTCSPCLALKNSPFVGTALKRELKSEWTVAIEQIKSITSVSNINFV